MCKLGHDRRLIFSWTGQVLHDDGNRTVIKAPWAGTDRPLFLGYTVFEPGDTFVETYYRERWFSIWQVVSHRTGRTKGWYCNICQPFERDGDELRFVDMELDVFVFPDGRFVILDEDDLERAQLPDSEKIAARAGLEEVSTWILERRPPFERIGPPRRVAPFWPEEPRHQG